MPKTVQATTVKPVGHKVLIKYLKDADTIGAIIIPDNLKDQRKGNKEVPAIKAQIIAIGDLETYNPIKAGDVVWVDPYSGIEFRLNNEKVMIIEEKYVYGLYEEQ